LVVASAQGESSIVIAAIKTSRITRACREE